MNFRLMLVISTGLLISAEAFSATELKISAGVSPAQNIFYFVTKSFEEKTGITITYTNKDPKGQGGDVVFKEVDQGIAEAGSSGAVWEDWVKLMETKGYKAKNLAQMKSRVIGRDRIHFITYMGGPKKLSDKQLKSVLSGEAKNWKEVGGEDQAISLILSADQPSTGNFLEERFMGGKKLATEKTVMLPKGQGTDGLIKTVATTKGAIAFGPVKLADKTVNSPEIPVVGRPLTMIWVGEPSAQLLKFMDFIAKEGPKLGVVQ